MLERRIALLFIVLTLLTVLPVSASAGRVGGSLYLSHDAATAQSAGRAAALAQLQARRARCGDFNRAGAGQAGA